MNSENAIYSSDNVFIDRNVIRTKSATYSVASIGSVSIKEQPTALGMILIMFFLLASIGSYQTSGWLCFFFFICMVMSAKLKKYEVRIKNSSGDQPVFIAKKKNVADSIKAGIERALAAR